MLNVIEVNDIHLRNHNVPFKDNVKEKGDGKEVREEELDTNKDKEAMDKAPYPK